MCHQSVGLAAGELERNGIATVCVSALEPVMRKVGPPRRLVVPFPLGYPLGEPGDPDLQRRVLRAALELLAHPGPAPVRRGFP